MKKVVFKFSRDLKQTLDEGTYDRMWDKIDEANGVITRVTNSRGADARDLAEAMRDLFDEKKDGLSSRNDHSPRKYSTP